MELQADIGLTIAGIIFLIFSLYYTIRIVRLLSINYYEFKRWGFVFLLLLGFVLGYGLLIGTQISNITLPVDPLQIVAIVYFFGAIFTLVTLGTVRNMLTSILGSEISNEKAIQVFRDYTNLTNSGIDLTQQFAFDCDFCDTNVSYSIADVVRSNITALDRGIAVEDIFGTKSFILRPTHRCHGGRREFNIIHDNDLEIRSIEQSRIIYGGQF
jgi:hypothetical protein